MGWDYSFLMLLDRILWGKGVGRYVGRYGLEENINEKNENQRYSLSPKNFRTLIRFTAKF